MALENYFVDKLDFQHAMSIVIEKHYLHRLAPCTHSFGLFRGDIDDIFPEIVGVVMYGSPASPNLCSGIAGEEYKDEIYELTRLWIDDSVPKNGESYLIGNTIKLLDKDIIVSFAEPTQGHLGVVYQATNFLYTGLSAKRTDWAIEGLQLKHTKTITNTKTSQQLKDEYGDRFSLVDRPRKHRYIYLKGSKSRKKELRNALKYEVLPYPKAKD